MPNTVQSDKPKPSPTFEMTPDVFQAKLNKTAKNFGLAPLINQIKVEEGNGQDAFSVELPDNMGLIGAVDPTNHKIRGLMLFANPSNDHETGSFTIMLGLLIATVDPVLSDQERGKITSNLFDNLKQEPTANINTSQNKINYSIKYNDGLGFMFGIEPQ